MTTIDEQDYANPLEQISHLKIALATNREIATAVGIFMVRHRISREQAFDLLAKASQRTNISVANLAEKIVTSEERSAAQ